MRKCFISILALFAVCSALFGQNKYEDIINGLAIDPENGTFERINVMTGEKESEDVLKAIQIFNLDAFNYYGFNEKYTSDLQKETFMKSKEYAEYLEYIKYDLDEIKNETYYILYNLRYNNKYDVNKRAFLFTLGQYDWQKSQSQGYITIGKHGICATFPVNRTKITSRNSYYNEIYVEQHITIPISNTEAAIQIEKAIDDPYCKAYLVFEVSIVKATKENHPSMPIPQKYLLTKTKALYLLDKSTKSVWDVSGALK